MSRSVYSTVHEWISKLREGEPFEIKFSKTIGGISTMQPKHHSPNAATITPCINPKQKKTG